MQGVYLVAAELSRLGFVVSPTSRSARGADLLLTDPQCRYTYSIQVKTKAVNAPYWLLSSHFQDVKARTHIYVFVNLVDQRRGAEYFVIPSTIVAEKGRIEPHERSIWYWFVQEDAAPFRDAWNIFGAGEQLVPV
jgi:hypothetical protein